MKEPTPDEKALLDAKFRTRIAPYLRRHAATLSKKESELVLKQFMPAVEELRDEPGFSDDPLHEDDRDIHPFPDVVHKYSTKILYLTTDECPVYCRYCTRKRRTLLSKGHKTSALQDVVGYLRDRPIINEVIFSGGDPMMLPVEDIFQRLRTFMELPSIGFVRIHTRALTTAPALFSKKFFILLENLRRDFSQKALHFVFHINTAVEMSAAVRDIVEKLAVHKVRSYAQAVLLKGVNDNAVTLAALLKELVFSGIQPYYLHQLDRVTGSAHFEVSDENARQLYSELKTLVPVYMLPKLVRDSKRGKTAL